jgi:hypothetical protein
MSDQQQSQRQARENQVEIARRLAALERDMEREKRIERPFRRLRAKVYRNNNQSIPTFVGTEVAISYTTAKYDYYGMWNAANPTRLLFPFTGCYGGGANIILDSNAAGFRTYFIRVNGVTSIANQTVQPSGASATGINIHWEEEFLAGDYIEVMIRQTSGVALNAVFSNMQSPVLWASYRP